MRKLSERLLSVYQNLPAMVVLFIFDVNTVYKHRVILADNAFCYDLDDFLCMAE